MRVTKCNEQSMVLLPPGLQPSRHVTAKEVSDSRQSKAPRWRDAHGKKVFAGIGFDLIPIEEVTEVVQIREAGGGEKGKAIPDTQSQYFDQLVSVGGERGNGQFRFLNSTERAGKVQSPISIIGNHRSTDQGPVPQT